MATAENKTQLQILKWLRANNYYCWREANLQRQIKGNYINNVYHVSGLPDIICLLPGGKYFGIEVKTITGRQSVDQAFHERRVKTLGGHYLLARSLKDVQDYLNQLSTS